ncbi:hypothetical protein SAMN05661080_04503 [Modestobacter sp. DSM 44400]|nr:hypothetical protein [Modestobacter sp. DSM 44400]SDY75470.1 hypothetical protein SAMN05661080_04503 [Modestobacter sp. DSM 44400]
MLLAGLLGWALLATVTAAVFAALGRAGLREEELHEVVPAGR